MSSLYSITYTRNSVIQHSVIKAKIVNKINIIGNTVSIIILNISKKVSQKFIQESMIKSYEDIFAFFLIYFYKIFQF
jgi:hypothetical protein